jgi:hypothetical protein
MIKRGSLKRNKGGGSRQYFESEKNMLKSKRSFEMAFSTIIVIILSLILLVMLIVIFNKSAGGFTDKITNYFTSSNVDTVKDSCNLYVDQNSIYEYCCVKKTIKLSSKQKYEMTCMNASQQSWGSSITKMDCTNAC